MKASELRSKNPGELQTELYALLKELFNLRVQKSMGQTAATHLFRQVKKNIARVKTILREKEGSL